MITIIDTHHHVDAGRLFDLVQDENTVLKVISIIRNDRDADARDVRGNGEGMAVEMAMVYAMIVAVVLSGVAYGFWKDRDRKR